jgi:hypothetical protein
MLMPHMRGTRRNFILGTGAALVGSALERVGADDLPITNPPNIRDLLLASGFNPDDPESVLLAVIGDTHMFADPDSSKYKLTLDDALVSELNGLNPGITDLVFAGDLIMSWSVAIAQPRYPNTYTYAHREFQAAKQQMARFRPGIRIWSVPGNHDTDRQETDAELWRTDMGTPPYQLSLLGGVPVFFLNSGHAGMLNDGQRVWFESEVKKIAADQEVLIIAHHPSFFYKYSETGLKRIVSQAFANHRAPIWLASGHSHQFAESLITQGNARFTQMSVTAGTARYNGDGKAPGYILLGLQGGRVVTRIFRSVVESGFSLRPSLDQLQPSRIEWPFDDIPYPAESYNEGFYDRTGRLVQFNGIDLKGHFAYCKLHTVRVNLSRAMGKITQFLLCGQIQSYMAPPICGFSISGADGTWTEVPYPAPNGNAIYRIAIPKAFQNSPNLYIRTRTQLQGTWDGINIYGWGLEADASRLTGYERWILRKYGTFYQNETTDPNTIPPGSHLSNLLLFAFNLDPAPPLPNASLPPNFDIRGQPVFSSIVVEDAKTFRFARRKSATHPGIAYTVEESGNLKDWSFTSPGRLKIMPLDDTWEEVQLDHMGGNGFFRVRLERDNDPEGRFLPWQAGIAVGGGTPSDRNGNSIDDLIEYAFDLPGNGGFRPYDPDRTGSKPGTPVIRSRKKPMMRIVHARMRADQSPGVRYVMEQSEDLSTWEPVPAEAMTERILRSSPEWDEVECLIDSHSRKSLYFRFKVEMTQPLPRQA